MQDCVSCRTRQRPHGSQCCRARRSSTTSILFLSCRNRLPNGCTGLREGQPGTEKILTGCSELLGMVERRAGADVSKVWQLRRGVDAQCIENAQECSSAPVRIDRKHLKILPARNGKKPVSSPTCSSTPIGSRVLPVTPMASSLVATRTEHRTKTQRGTPRDSRPCA